MIMRVCEYEMIWGTPMTESHFRHRGWENAEIHLTQMMFNKDWCTEHSCSSFSVIVSAD